MTRGCHVADSLRDSGPSEASGKGLAMLFPSLEQAPCTSTLRLESDSSRRLLRLAGVLAGLTALALLVDLPVYRFCSAGQLSGDLRRLLTWSEVFAHGIGVGILALTMFLLDPSHRRQVPRVVASALGGGLVADLVKLTVARIRPGHFSASSVGESFAGWLPTVWPVEGFVRFDHRLQSFPSAHTAVAAGLAVSLSAVYPRGRYLFAFFAILAAGQRIECGAHFLSDTLAGAAVGCLVAATVSGRGRFAPVFDRLEKGTKEKMPSTEYQVRSAV